MADEPLSAYVRRCRARPTEGPDWLADEIQVLEDALAHCVARQPPERFRIVIPFGPEWLEEHYPDWAVIDSDDGMTVAGGTSYLLEARNG